MHTPQEHARLAEEAYSQAALFDGSRNEGKFGWLYLLKAWDYDKTNRDVAENIAVNYEPLSGSYAEIGYAELKSANYSIDFIRQFMSQPEQYDAALTKTFKLYMGARDPGEGCTGIAFATAFSTWDIGELFGPANIARMNKAIHDKAVAAYLKLKASRPLLNATDLNHALWDVQRRNMDRESGTFWAGFGDIEGFRELTYTMRKAAARFLGHTHGLGELAGAQKAANPLVVWVSVHLDNSVHQPHVTEDALVGGVYYVSVPAGSGKLELYDPRGKHPNYLDPLAPTMPPFHRTIQYQPAPGKLLLFPGWLVHSVRPSANVVSDGYRVSISLNLKGEWQDTGALSLGCRTYS